MRIRSDRRAVLPIVLLAAGIAAPSYATPIESVSIDLHLTFPSYGGCAHEGVQDDELTCAALTPVSPQNETPIFAWVIVSGLDGGATGLEFGICYEPSIVMGPWTACVTGFEYAQSHWPASGSGNSVTWGECLVPANAERMTRVGYFQIMQGSDGAIELSRDPRVGDAGLTDCAEGRRSLCPDRAGKARANGGVGLVTCGAPTPCDPGDEWEVCQLTPILGTTWAGLKARFR